MRAIAVVSVLSAVVGAGVGGGAAGCGAPAPNRAALGEEDGGDDVLSIVFDDEPDVVYDADGNGPVQDLKAPFERIGARYTAASPRAIQVRTSVDGTTWSEWRALTIVFSEESAQAGHVDVEGAAARFVQHRVTPGELPPTFVVLEPVARIPVIVDDADSADAGGEIDASAESAVEEGLNVTIRSRAAWGARPPRCKSLTGVRKATVHHTAGANDDSTPIAVQLRQIQAFHMNTRGWCDIGYNFVVSRDGQIWEGRGYGVMGAHTENANTDNMGIVAIGNYQTVEPPVKLQIGIAKALRYLHDRGGIPLTRDGDNGVKGHRQRGTTVTECPGDKLYAKLAAIVQRAVKKDFDAPDPLSITPAEEAALGLMHFYAPAGTTDVDGDGTEDICARNSTTIRCRLSDGHGFSHVVDGPNLSNESGWVNAPRYETLRMGDINGDGKADLCGRSSAGLRCWKSRGGAAGFGAAIAKDIMSTESGWAEPWHYATITFADVNGDGKADVCGRRDAGFRCWLSNGNGFPTEVQGPPWSDANGWRRVERYGSIRMGDVNGDGRADACADNGHRVRCFLATNNGLTDDIDGPAWSDADGFDQVEHWSTIDLVDVNGDGKADLCARLKAGIECHLSRGRSFGAAIAGPALSDHSGWNAASSYATIRFGDIDGDGDNDLCARGGDGVRCWKWTGHDFAGSAIHTGLFSNGDGWTAANKYRTIRLADVDGDGRADLCGRGSLGMRCFHANGHGFGDEVRAAMYSNDNGWDQEMYYGTIRLGR